jgi:hypothetical protein
MRSGAKKLREGFAYAGAFVLEHQPDRTSSDGHGGSGLGGALRHRANRLRVCSTGRR